MFFAVCVAVNINRFFVIFILMKLFLWGKKTVKLRWVKSSFWLFWICCCVMLIWSRWSGPFSVVGWIFSLKLQEKRTKRKKCLSALWPLFCYLIPPWKKNNFKTMKDQDKLQIRRSVTWRRPVTLRPLTVSACCKSLINHKATSCLLYLFIFLHRTSGLVTQHIHMFYLWLQVYEKALALAVRRGRGTWEGNIFHSCLLCTHVKCFTMNI